MFNPKDILGHPKCDAKDFCQSGNIPAGDIKESLCHRKGERRLGGEDAIMQGNLRLASWDWSFLENWLLFLHFC